MEDDNLFSNFSRQEAEPSSKKEKSFIGKKRNGEELKNNKPESNKIAKEKDGPQSGQNLENIINEKMEVENINEKNEGDIVEINEVDMLKKEKEHLKNQIVKVYPEIDEEIKKIKNTPKPLNENNKDINNKDININNNKSSEVKNQNSELSKTKSRESQAQNPSPNQEISKITFDYEQEKEKYDNLISDEDIQIDKEKNFKKNQFYVSRMVRVF